MPGCLLKTNRRDFMETLFTWLILFVLFSTVISLATRVK